MTRYVEIRAKGQRFGMFVVGPYGDLALIDDSRFVNLMNDSSVKYTRLKSCASFGGKHNR
jgi:hypothetical protein